MGGIGSGRKLTKKALTVEAALRLDLRAIREAVAKQGSMGCSITWSIGQVTTTAAVFLRPDEVVVVRDGRAYRAALAWRDGRFGGRFPALLCPGCARARRTLYLASDLRCRECHQLGYASQRSSPGSRAQLRMAKVMSSLGVNNISDLDLIARPKYMRLRRYLALLDALGSASTSSFLSAQCEIRKIGEKLAADA